MTRRLISIFFFIAIVINSVASCIVFIMLIILIWRKPKRKNIVHAIARLWARNNLRLILTRMKVVGIENIDYSKNYVVISNHASNFDIFMLLGHLGLRTIFISKEANFKIPFIGLCMREMGCIPISRSNNKLAWQSIEKGVNSYQQGDSLIIFPEGTRSSTGGVMTFKTGFLHLAKKNPIQILPVTLSGTSRIQPKGSWLITPSRIEMVIGKPRVVASEEVTTFKQKQQIASELEDSIRRSFDPNYC